RFHEREAVVVHQEVQRRAVCSTSETIVELFGRIDPERGGLLGVEGAIGLVLPAGALQRHARADEFDQVGAGDQVVDEGSGNAAGHGPSLPWRWRCGRRYLRLRMRWMSHSTTP